MGRRCPGIQKPTALINVERSRAIKKRRQEKRKMMKSQGMVKSDGLLPQRALSKKKERKIAHRRKLAAKESDTAIEKTLDSLNFDMNTAPDKSTEKAKEASTDVEM